MVFQGNQGKVNCQSKELFNKKIIFWSDYYALPVEHVCNIDRGCKYAAKLSEGLTKLQELRKRRKQTYTEER